jgi:hypothetical protein
LGINAFAEKRHPYSLKSFAVNKPDKESLFVALVERMTQQRQDVFGDHCLEGEPRVVLRQLTEHAYPKIMVDEEYYDFVGLMIAESKRFFALAQIFLQNITQPSLEILSRINQLILKDNNGNSTRH